jgi:HrpA-like RNA helicase
MAGREEIHEVIKKINEEKFSDLAVLPLHATLSSDEQHKVFDN